MDLGQKSDASYHQELDGIESVDHLNVQGILEFQESNGEDCPTLQLDSSVRMLTSLTDSLSKYHPFMYLDACGPINNNMAVPVAAKEEELERYYDNLRLKYQTLNLNIIPDVADFYPYRQWRQKAMKKQVQDNSLFSIIINGFVSIFNMSSDVVDKTFYLEDVDLDCMDFEEIRSKVFRGGIKSNARPLLWPFLLKCPGWTLDTVHNAQVLSQYWLRYRSDVERYLALLRQDGEHKALLLTESDQIIRDLRRTCQDMDFFRQDETSDVTVLNNKHLISLYNILTVASCYHLKLSQGYSQGMSDIVAVLFYVLRDEALTYVAFQEFMRSRQIFFAPPYIDLANERRVLSEHVKRVLPELYACLVVMPETKDMAFAHEWLLLWCRRQFSFIEDPDAKVNQASRFGGYVENPSELCVLWDAYFSTPWPEDFHYYVILAILKLSWDNNFRYWRDNKGSQLFECGHLYKALFHAPECLSVSEVLKCAIELREAQ